VTVRACVGLRRVRAVSIRSCKACPGRWGNAGSLVAVVRLVRCSACIRACNLWFGCVAPKVRASLPWLQVGHSDRVLDHGLIRGGGGSCGVVCVGPGVPALAAGWPFRFPVLGRWDSACCKCVVKTCKIPPNHRLSCLIWLCWHSLAARLLQWVFLPDLG